MGNLPYNWRLWGPPEKELTEFVDLAAVTSAPARLSRLLPGICGEVLGSRHHDNHAYLAYALSPFYAQARPRIISA